MASHGKSAREIQEEVERALHRQRTRARRSWLSIVRGAFFVVLVPALLLALIWAALVGIHVSKEATIGDSIAMTVDDARVASSCPGQPGLVLDFLGRSEAVPLGQVLSPDGVTQAVQLVCDGDYASVAAVLAGR